MRKFSIAILLALLITSIARADSPAPLRDFSKLTPDGQYIFVLLAQDIRDGYTDGGIREDAELRAIYSSSGLYSVSDPNQMLYSVDWNAFNIDLSRNGEYLVRWGPWASKSDYSDIAVEFYHNGQLSQSYKVSDLTTRFSKLPHSVSHYMWIEDYVFDEQSQRLTLDLESGEHYVFDITNGKIIEQDKGINIAQIGLGLLLMIILAIAGWLIMRQRRTA